MIRLKNNKAAGGTRTARLNLQYQSTTRSTGKQINFHEVNQLAMSYLPALLLNWLPYGKVSGHEYTSLNPKRYDRHLGSFKVNMNTGRWADFSTGDAGGDLISLAAYLSNKSQSDAAKGILAMLGVSHG